MDDNEQPTERIDLTEMHRLFSQLSVAEVVNLQIHDLGHRLMELNGHHMDLKSKLVALIGLKEYEKHFKRHVEDTHRVVESISNALQSTQRLQRLDFEDEALIVVDQIQQTCRALSSALIGSNINVQVLDSCDRVKIFGSDVSDT